MSLFVAKDSIVRKIWGNSDTVLFIFAGAAAEFALNKAVDWLYFTGKLPADPIGRLFSTVSYAKMIIFNKTDVALAAIDKITAIHSILEDSRGASIPDWAYRDVLFMLIDYSVRSYQLLYNKLTAEQKEEVFQVFYKVGDRMRLQQLPKNYQEFTVMRHTHLQQDLAVSSLSTNLMLQYKKHLGNFRYALLLKAQQMVVPNTVSSLLNMQSFNWLQPAVVIYKGLRIINAHHVLRNAMLPKKYLSQIKQLDVDY
ncbi:MAG: oxygenase MpaB family protein [Ferruginibacter sp.]